MNSKEVVKIRSSEVEALIDSITPGKYFSVTFEKRDGSFRFLETIKDLSFGVTGSGGPYEPRERGIVNLYDIDLAATKEPKESWRAVRYDSVRMVVFSVGGEMVAYSVINES